MAQYTLFLDRDFEEMIEKHHPNQKRQPIIREALRYWFLHYWEDPDLENALISQTLRRLPT